MKYGGVNVFDFPAQALIRKSEIRPSQGIENIQPTNCWIIICSTACKKQLWHDFPQQNTNFHQRSIELSVDDRIPIQSSRTI